MRRIPGSITGNEDHLMPVGVAFPLPMTISQTERYRNGPTSSICHPKLASGWQENQEPQDTVTGDHA